MQFCLHYDFSVLSGKPSGFTSKDSILGGLRRRAEVRGSSGHQDQGKTSKQAKARTGIKAHGRAPEHHARLAGQQLGTGWPCHVCTARKLTCFAILFFGHLSFRVFLFVFLLL